MQHYIPLSLKEELTKKIFALSIIINVYKTVFF